MPQGRNDPPLIRQPGKVLRLLIVALALLVLTAHFLRAGNLALVALTSVMVALLFVRRPPEMAWDHPVVSQRIFPDGNSSR